MAHAVCGQHILYQTGLCGNVYEIRPKSIEPYWISRELVVWPWCNLAARQRRPYCPSVNSHYSVGLVSRQWDTIDWACVLCDCCIHNDQASQSASLWQCSCPFYNSHAGVFGKASHHQGLSPRFDSLQLLVFFSKAKIATEKDEIGECNSHTVHKLSQCHLTAEWLAPLESDFTDAQ